MSWLRPVPLLLLVVGLFAALTVGSLTGTLGVVVVACLASFVVDDLLFRAADLRPLDGLRRIESGPGWRFFSREMLVVVFLLRSAELSRTPQVVVVAAVVVRHVVLGLFLVARLVVSRRRLPRVVTQNLGAGSTGRLPPVPSPLLMRDGHRLVMNCDVLVGLALAWAWIDGSYALVAPAAVLAVIVALAIAAPLLPRAWSLLRGPGDERLMRAAQAAVEELAPRVILYFSGGIDAVYQVNMWLETMERLDQPALVLLRERRYLDHLDHTSAPILCLPFSVDLMNFEFPAARVALYVANVGKNIHLLRDPRLKSAFIGHGDSDKTASFNPFTKVYDEVWVAGEAGRQRYLRAQVGVRDEQIVLVGRPQLDAVQTAAPRPAGAAFTVLYAPTWEGWTEDPTQSSLIPMGIEIVRLLLATPGVRVLYKPHPMTGTVKPVARQASDSIAKLLAEAGPQHVFVQGATTLYECFDESDALISDISSVVSDYLRSEKPYLVTNGGAVPDEEFRDQNASAGAAYLIGPDAAGLVDGLAQARGDDPLRDRRREVRAYLLGDPNTQAMSLFRKALDDLLAKSEANQVERRGLGDEDWRAEDADQPGQQPSTDPDGAEITV